MSSVRLRSPRDPGFWLPLLLSLLVIAPAAIGGYVWVAGFIERLQQDAATDPAAAIDEAIRVMRRAIWLLCVIMTAFCAYLFRYCQLARREGRLPPSGRWSYGALHAVVGARAERMGLLGQWLAGLLLAATIGLLFAVEYFSLLIDSGGLSQ